MPTLISDVFVPAIWTKALSEQRATYPTILNSGAAMESDLLSSLASGGGTSVNVPFFRDITSQADEIQVENTPPATDNAITAGVQVAPVLNRVCKSSATALSSAVSGEDVVPQIIQQLADRRAMQRNATAIALLRGAFGTAAGAALNNAASLSAVRRTIATETGLNPPANQMISPNDFIDACALLGENSNLLQNGVFVVHPVVLATLMKLDAASFKNGVQSGLPYTIKTYREVPIITSAALVRAGTTSGFVYDSYILAAGTIGKGEKPQVADSWDTVDVAALQFEVDKDRNNKFIYDRTRFISHINGMRWIGTPAQQSATNAELQTFANWNLIYQTANRVGAACIVSNG